MDSEVQEKVAESQAAVKDFLEKAGDEVSAKTYSYKCEVSTGAAGGGFLNVNFIKNGKTFAQFKGGFVGGVGAYTGWGRAWFSKPVEQLIGELGPLRLSWSAYWAARRMSRLPARALSAIAAPVESVSAAAWRPAVASSADPLIPLEKPARRAKVRRDFWGMP